MKIHSWFNLVDHKNFTGITHFFKASLLSKNDLEFIGWYKLSELGHSLLGLFMHRWDLFCWRVKNNKRLTINNYYEATCRGARSFSPNAGFHMIADDRGGRWQNVLRSSAIIWKHTSVIRRSWSQTIQEGVSSIYESKSLWVMNQRVSAVTQT